MCLSFSPQISPEEISNFVDDNDFPNYLQKMSRSRTWGGQLEILALANALQRNIWIISSCEERGGEHIVVESGNARLEPLLLGYVADKHYVSLEPSRQLTAIDGKLGNIEGKITFPFICRAKFLHNNE